MNGVTNGTPTKLPFGAGVFAKGVPFNPLVAPTLEQIKQGLMGATKGGGGVTITPKLFDPELDDVTVKVAELSYHKFGEEGKMDISFAELTPGLVNNMVLGTVGETTDKNYDVITSHVGALQAGHIIEGLCYYGEFMNGRPWCIVAKKALITSGMPVEGSSATNTVFKGTAEICSDLEYGTNKLPYAIFIYKEDKFVPATPEQAAQAAE